MSKFIPPKYSKTAKFTHARKSILNIERQIKDGIIPMIDGKPAVTQGEVDEMIFELKTTIIENDLGWLLDRRGWERFKKITRLDITRGGI